MNIEIKNCLDCPFHSAIYDDYAVSYSTLDKCMLAQHLMYDDYVIDVRDLHDELKNTTPEWCPINNTLIINKVI
jgi:hypothetical protein